MLTDDECAALVANIKINYDEDSTKLAKKSMPYDILCSAMMHENFTNSDYIRVIKHICLHKGATVKKDDNEETYISITLRDGKEKTVKITDNYVEFFGRLPPPFQMHVNPGTQENLNHVESVEEWFDMVIDSLTEGDQIQWGYRKGVPLNDDYVRSVLLARPVQVLTEHKDKYFKYNNSHPLPFDRTFVDKTAVFPGV